MFDFKIKCLILSDELKINEQAWIDMEELPK